MLVLMYDLKKNGKVFTSKFVGTGPSSYEKRIYRLAVLQRLRNTGLSAAAAVVVIVVVVVVIMTMKQYVVDRGRSLSV